MSRAGSFRSMRLPRKPWQAAALLALAAGVAALQQWHVEPSSPTASGSFKSSSSRVARVVDGDTLKLVNHKESIRLIGVDTPETVKRNCPVQPWGPEATQFTKDFVAGGAIRLEYDGDTRDKYGRILAYVWVGDRMLNEELLRAGLARAEMQYHYSKDMKSRFRRAEAEARVARRGIWSDGDNSEPKSAARP
jgi:micrococcal nuclease